jgi:hypothetical protein
MAYSAAHKSTLRTENEPIGDLPGVISKHKGFDERPARRMLTYPGKGLVRCSALKFEAVSAAVRVTAHKRVCGTTFLDHPSSL